MTRGTKSALRTLPHTSNSTSSFRRRRRRRRRRYEASNTIVSSGGIIGTDDFVVRARGATTNIIAASHHGGNDVVETRHGHRRSIVVTSPSTIRHRRIGIHHGRCRRRGHGRIPRRRGRWEWMVRFPDVADRIRTPGDTRRVGQ